MKKKSFYFFSITAFVFILCFFFIFKSFINLSFNNNIQNAHLSTEDAWSNDLQTIVWNDDKNYFDIYFLHSADGATNPFGNRGQNWVHTTTSDFITYSRQNSAIDARGGDSKEGWKSAWTGSIIKNTRWISKIPKGVPLAYFTGLKKTDNSQNIYLAYSDDGGKTFSHVLNDGKPVLTTKESFNHSDFRDPYVFEYQDRLLMYVAEGDVIGAYQSKDGLTWSSADDSGSKILSETFFNGRIWAGNTPVECPVLKTLSTKNGQKKQVLFFGAKDVNAGETTGTYYTVGHLSKDGLFVAETETERLDQGSDYYGANFSGHYQIEQSNKSLLTLGWVGNWNYFTNGIHSDEAAKSPYLKHIGFYSSPRELQLNDDYTLFQTPYYPKKHLKLIDSYKHIHRGKPISYQGKEWVDRIVDGNKVYGIYDIPNLPASAVYKLNFSTTSNIYSGKIFIDIWQGKDSVQFEFQPSTGSYHIVAYASELENGIDSNKNNSAIYTNKTNEQEGYTIDSGYMKQKSLSFTIISDNRSLEFFFPNGNSYTIARFNTSGRQDFKVFTEDTNHTNWLDLAIYHLQ